LSDDRSGFIVHLSTIERDYSSDFPQTYEKKTSQKNQPGKRRWSRR
jgi:hypothetical protein